MPVFRIERTRNYTVMSNYHLRDCQLSLAAKGLLSQMLSLPENWDYTLSGLTRINREGKDAIRTCLRELERAGYLHRRQTKDENGRFSRNEYVIYELPQTVPPEETDMLCPLASAAASSSAPLAENTLTAAPTQLNIDQPKKEKQKTDATKIDSIPSVSSAPPTMPEFPIRSESRRKDLIQAQELQEYGDVIRENISYDWLLAEYPDDRHLLEEIVGLMTETVCTRRATVWVARELWPADVVRSRLLKLDAEHIRFVLDCMKQNTTAIRSIRQYLLTSLFNAPNSISSYYAARVNHDLAAGAGCSGGSFSF